MCVFRIVPYTYNNDFFKVVLIKCEPHFWQYGAISILSSHISQKLYFLYLYGFTLYLFQIPDPYQCNLICIPVYSHFFANCILIIQ